MSVVVEFDSIWKHYPAGGLVNRALYVLRPNRRIGQLGQGPGWALRDVSFTLESGQSLGLIGRNGAGKTTILRLLAGITQPTAGRIRTRGRVAALVALGAGFHRELTGRENIYLNGTILGLTRTEIRRKFDDIVEFAELGEYIDMPVKFYSSGMYVRLGFSVAVHVEPDILLVDEVLAVGDVGFRMKSFDRMKRFSDSGCTIVLVSHRMTVITTMCDQAIWLDRGAVREMGDPQEVTRHYLEAIEQAEHFPFPLVTSRADPARSPIVLTEVALLTSDGHCSEAFHYGDDLIVRLHYEAFRDVESPQFIVGVVSKKGALFDALMPLDGQAPDVIPQGMGYVDCVFRGLPLKTGTYYVTAQIRRDIMANYYERRTVAQFRIVSPASTYGYTTRLSDAAIQGTSPIFVPYQWEVNPKRGAPY